VNYSFLSRGSSNSPNLWFTALPLRGFLELRSFRDLVEDC
jgi:hypothetical protein